MLITLSKAETVHMNGKGKGVIIRQRIKEKEYKRADDD